MVVVVGSVVVVVIGSVVVDGGEGRGGCRVLIGVIWSILIIL